MTCGNGWGVALPDVLLEAMSFAVSRLLASTNWKQDLQAVLGQVGPLIRLRYACVIENAPAADCSACQWSAPGLDGEDILSLFVALPPWMRESLEQGRCFWGSLDEWPPQERTKLAGLGIQSVWAVPIQPEGTWWGSVVFGYSLPSSEGSAVEVKIAAILANLIEAAVRCEKQALERGEMERRYQALFEQTDDGIFLLSLDGVLVSLNKQAARMLGYEVHELEGESFQRVLATQEEEQSLSRLQRLISGEELPVYTRILRRRNGEEFPVEVRASLVRDADGSPLYVQVIVRDITARQQAEEELRRRDSILEVLAYASERLLLGNPDDVVPDLLGRLGRAVDVNRVYVFENHRAENGTLLASQRYEWVAPGQLSTINAPEMQNLPYRAGGFARLVDALGTGQPLHGRIRHLPTSGGRPAEQDVCSTALVPIFSEGKWWGILGFEKYERERKWPSAEIETLKNIANTLGAAFARQRIQASEREQRDLAEALRDTAAVLNSTLNFDEVLDHILANVGRVVPHDGTNIMLIEGGTLHIARRRGYSRGEIREMRLSKSYSVEDFPSLYHMAQTRMPLVISDVGEYPGWVDLPESEEIRSYAGVPICLEGEVIGFLNVNSSTPGFFKHSHAERLQAFADQAAVAIKNARLYDQAQALAALEERQRLARELHDGVSQTLSSAKLIADVLPRIWGRDPEKAEQALLQLRQLTQGALAEMRMLLMELRPETLLEAELIELLRQAVQVTASRTGISVSLTANAQKCTLPSEVKFALYRITQEALNNVAKHAHAERVEVHLTCRPDRVVLRIWDDGRGFEVDNVPAGHFGIGIMRERAHEIGANLKVESRIGGGTEVTVVWESSCEVTKP